MNNISMKFDFTKSLNEQLPTFNYYENEYKMMALNIQNLRQELQRKDNNLNELKNTLETCIYGIEPKGCSINYNCEYDSEEDYIRAMQEQSRLNTYKFVLDKIKEIESK